MPEAVAKRIHELRREIEGHNRRYYLLDAPTVSDAEYDGMLRELENLERVKGIGPSLMTQVREHVTVAAEAAK